MKYLIICVLFFTSAFTRELVNVANMKNIELKTVIQTKLPIVKRPQVDFYTILITINEKNLSFNPNIQNNDEKVFQTLVDGYQYIFKDYNFKNNISLGLISGNDVYGKMILVIDKNDLNKLEKQKDIPQFPLRKLFKNAKIYTSLLISSGIDLKYSEVKTQNFIKYIQTHIFKYYYEELKNEENYTEYEKYKGYIFGCSIDNDIKCVKQYLAYGYDINQLEPNTKQTPLIYATINNNYEIVKLLLDNGADANLYPDGYENAYLAAKRKGYSKVSILLKPFTTMIVRPNSSKFSISSSDLKYICIAGSKRNDNTCFNIQNKDTKNTCFGISKSSNYCYSIKDEDLKNFCLGKSQKSSFCYNIKNKDLKNSCIGITSQQNNACYNIQNSNLKSMCLGISSNSNNCYSIK